MMLMRWNRGRRWRVGTAQSQYDGGGGGSSVGGAVEPQSRECRRGPPPTRDGTGQQPASEPPRSRLTSVLSRRDRWACVGSGLRERGACELYVRRNGGGAGNTQVGDEKEGLSGGEGGKREKISFFVKSMVPAGLPSWPRFSFIGEIMWQKTAELRNADESSEKKKRATTGCVSHTGTSTVQEYKYYYYPICNV